jgi:hypothetical protein
MSEPRIEETREAAPAAAQGTADLAARPTVGAELGL